MTMGQVIKYRLLQSHELGVAERVEMQEFAALLHWNHNMIMCNGLRHVRLWGEARSVDNAAITQEIENPRDKFAYYELKLIFKMDEMGLFFKMLPQTTYVSSKEDCATTRGTKGMRSKDRLTVLVCSNSDGSLKVPLAIVGNSKNPRCFRMEKFPCTTCSKTKRGVINEPYEIVYFSIMRLNLPFVRVHMPSSKKVALLIDNFALHDKDVLEHDRVDIYFLAPNCTAIHQPMDAGVIAALKAHYWASLLARILEILLERQQFRECAKNLTKGIKGSAKGHDALVIHVASILKDSRQGIPIHHILHCWVKAYVLPPTYSADLENAMGKVRIEDVNALDDFQACIKSMKSMDISSYEGLNSEDKDVHQSLAIIRKEAGSDIWQR